MFAPRRSQSSLRKYGYPIVYWQIIHCVFDEREMGDWLRISRKHLLIAGSGIETTYANKGWFPVRTTHSREFVYVFCFASCKTSQNVNISQLLTWSKFKVKEQPPLWMRSGRSLIPRSFSYYFMKQLHNFKNQWSCWKKNLKGLGDKVRIS